MKKGVRERNKKGRNNKVRAAEEIKRWEKMNK